MSSITQITLTNFFLREKILIIFLLNKGKLNGDELLLFRNVNETIRSFN